MRRQMVGFLAALLLTSGLGIRGQAHAWVQGYQPFPDGDATVVLHRFCQKRDCGSVSQHRWQQAIQMALDAWNEAEANFRFHTRPVQAMDDPCNLPGEVAVILSEPGRLCPGDGPLPRGEISGRTEFPAGGGARVYINAEDHLFRWIQQDSVLVNPVVTYLLHEFGHVVGLGHPDEAGQQVLAVMNADFDLFDNELFPDDIAGIQALYPHAAVSGGVLESPAHGALVSGIGFIGGWKCEARRLTVRINKGSPTLLASGIPRADTRSVCGDTTNGFITQVNWSWPHLGAGQHTVVVYDDGVEFARSTFTVGSTGEEFLKGVSVEIDVPDFPAPGETGRFVWSEATQHLELAEVIGGGESEPQEGSLSPSLYGAWSILFTATTGPEWLCNRGSGGAGTGTFSVRRVNNNSISGTLHISTADTTSQTSLSGQVSPSGSSGSVRGHFFTNGGGELRGTLSGTSGSGSWTLTNIAANDPTIGCSGTWTATKR